MHTTLTMSLHYLVKHKFPKTNDIYRWAEVPVDCGKFLKVNISNTTYEYSKCYKKFEQSSRDARKPIAFPVQ